MTVLAWCLLAVAALVILSGLGRGSRRHPGHLPGDFDFELFGRRWSVPLASTVLLSLLLSWLVRW